VEHERLRDGAAARRALASISARRSQVIAEVDMPRWYWSGIALAWIALAWIALA
jgi:hypothetical protein